MLNVLGEGWHILKVAGAHGVQAGTQDARIFSEHPLLDVAVLQDVHDLVAEHGQGQLVFGVGPDVVHQLCLRISFRGIAE